MAREAKTENEVLKDLISLEDLAEKKASIYGRLLMDSALAQKMEALSARHKQRRESLETLLYGKEISSKKKEGGEK